MSKASAKKNIVVLGGGCHGVLAAQQIAAKLDTSQYQLILVDKRPHHIWMIAGARMTVTPDDSLFDNYVYTYDRVFPKGNGIFKTGKVISINENKGSKGGELVFENKETLAYEALVLALGSVWPGALSFPDTKDGFKTHVDEWREKYKSADDITIVGGGAVGIELAGELRDEYPKKKITLVHALPNLLNPAYPDKLRKYMEAQLKARNIDLVLGEYVETFPAAGSKDLVMRSGKKISTSFVVTAMGPKPNTDLIVASLGEDAVAENKRVKITPHMQLPNHPSIFAVGDIIDYPEQTQAAKANGHAPVVSANVVSYVTDRPLTKEYKGMPEAIVITNGRNGGVVFMPYLWGIMLGPWLARLMKSKTLFLWMIRPRMGY